MAMMMRGCLVDKSISGEVPATVTPNFSRLQIAPRITVKLRVREVRIRMFFAAISSSAEEADVWDVLETNMTSGCDNELPDTGCFESDQYYE
jgi:hypothetical protein